MVLGLSAHLIYEYFKNKEETKNLRKGKAEKIQKLIMDSKPIVTPSNAPIELLPYIDMINKWGIGMELLRENLYANSDSQDLTRLKEFIDMNINLINNVIDNSEDKKLKNALKNTLLAYNELGLWSWDMKDAISVQNEKSEEPAPNNYL